MGQFRLSLLELHGDLNVGPKSFGFDSADDATETEDSSGAGSRSEGDEETGGAGLALLVGLGFLVVLGLAVKRRRDDGTDPTVEQPVELAESDDL